MIFDTRRKGFRAAHARYRARKGHEQRQPPRRWPTCRRCDTSVIDDAGFYECPTCGDTDLVLAAVATEEG